MTFLEITKDEIRKEISRLDGAKAIPIGDISAEMLKSTIDVHVSLLTKIINSSIRSGCFVEELKTADVTQSLIKMMIWKKKTISMPVFCLMCQRSLKGSCISKLKVS